MNSNRKRIFIPNYLAKRALFIGALVVVLITISVLSVFAEHKRSSRWDELRDTYLKEHPSCAVCGCSKDLQVHHIKIFSIYPELELDPSNLITLCTSKYWGFNCHLVVGHGGNFRYYNPWVEEDAGIMRVYASPGYIRGFGDIDKENYISMIRARVKQYNMGIKRRTNDESKL